MSVVRFFLHKSILVSRLGGSWVSGLCAGLYEGARSLSYLESLSRVADTFHKYIKLSDEVCLKRGFEWVVKDGLKKLKLRDVELAVDTTKDLYYGREEYYTRGVKYDRGADLAWEFVVISIVKPVNLPLMVLPYRTGDTLSTLVIELLKYVQTLRLSVKKIYFDRGFYDWHLIDYLESSKLPYLIFVPKSSKIKDFIEQTEGKKLGVYEHQGRYPRDKTIWKPKTKIVVCKNVGQTRKGEWYDMCFATNLKPRYSLASEYRRRWNIETSFRVMKEAKIKTKSNHPLIRFFYFLLRALFMLVWTIRQHLKEKKLIFKIFLRKARHHWQQTLNTTQPFLNPPP